MDVAPPNAGRFDSFPTGGVDDRQYSSNKSNKAGRSRRLFHAAAANRRRRGGNRFEPRGHGHCVSTAANPSDQLFPTTRQLS